VDDLTFDRNIDTMKQYKLNQNVLVLAGDHHTPIFGTIIGFEYNEIQEICLVIQEVEVCRALSPWSAPRHIINPNSRSLTITTI
jgi:hypothetical protein